jgi:hypothetical protein
MGQSTEGENSSLADKLRAAFGHQPTPLGEQQAMMGMASHSADLQQDLFRKTGLIVPSEELADPEVASDTKTSDDVAQEDVQ